LCEVTKDSLLASVLCKPEPFAAPDGSTFFLRPFAVVDTLAVREWQKANSPDLIYQILFVRAVCDEAGNRLFADAEAPTVSEFRWPIVEAVARRVLEMNGIGEKAEAPKAPSATTAN
jgi:hypothetical protein